MHWLSDNFRSLTSADKLQGAGIIKREHILVKIKLFTKLFQYWFFWKDLGEGHVYVNVSNYAKYVKAGAVIHSVPVKCKVWFQVMQIAVV